jgi:hypothetical protein
LCMPRGAVLLRVTQQQQHHIHTAKRTNTRQIVLTFHKPTQVHDFTH